ncbi:MAG: hypothetical protein Q7S34_00815 [bacterium]|nr:hypothetical protein [bacterium]
MHRQLRFVIWFPIIIVAAFAAGYLFWQQTLIPGPYDLEPMSVVRNGRGDLSRDEVLRGWQTYRNEKYGFEFKHPTNFVIKSEGEINGYIENITVQEPKDSFYFWMELGISSKKSVESYNASCEGECYRFEYLNCEKDNTKFCSEYSHGFGGEYYMIKSTAFQNTDKILRVDARINLELIYYQSDLNIDLNNFSDNTLESLARDNPSKEYLVRDLSDVAIYNQILSTFKFLTTEAQKSQESAELCVQVITPARNPQTGEVRNFSTPCDVPEGWEVVQ